jgi:hypothetical protein
MITFLGCRPGTQRRRRSAPFSTAPPVASWATGPIRQPVREVALEGVQLAPNGSDGCWENRTPTLDEDLVVRAQRGGGEATIVFDEYENNYQRIDNL